MASGAWRMPALPELPSGEHLAAKVWRLLQRTQQAALDLMRRFDVQEVDLRLKGERDAYKLLYAGFMAAPLIAGFDKFTDKLGNWDKYLSDDVAEKLPV